MKKLMKLIAILALLATSLTIVPAVEAGPKACAKRVNDTAAKLTECVTLTGVRGHQQTLQDIADDNGGTRAANTPGFDASAEYVHDTLVAAGYNVSYHEFDLLVFADPILEQTAPDAETYETGTFSGSGFGDVTDAVTSVDINLVPPRANTSGCDGAYTEASVGAPIVADPGGADDFAGFPAGTIALMQRGGCSFALKAVNAEAAGAGAAVIFNQGNTPDREGLIVGNATPPLDSDIETVGIPVVGASFADGAALSEATEAHVQQDEPDVVVQRNVIAESKTGDPDHVIMAGAHLDSVPAGPGINDNGSGSSAILEVALQMAKVKPINKVRFAWWGGEEEGLVGSTAYVADLSEAQADKIDLYLNFDMIGSPNYTFGIYDGDDSDEVGSGPGPDGSAEIEAVFEAFFTSRDEPFTGTDFTGRSDYGPFIAIGIPAGGLFTGAEVPKTAEEAEIFGGTAGVPLDPCYHQACDTFSNNNNHALDVNSDAVATAVILYAMGVETLP